MNTFHNSNKEQFWKGSTLLSKDYKQITILRTLSKKGTVVYNVAVFFHTLPLLMRLFENYKQITEKI